jgi:hypothetical protein
MKKLMHNMQFGKPNTALWWALSILVQLNVEFKLQAKAAWAFLSNINFSSNCKKEDMKPIAAAIVMIPYCTF